MGNPSIQNAAALLTAETLDVDLPSVFDFDPLRTEAYEYHLEYLDDRRDLYDDVTLQAILGGAEFSATEYAAARSELARSRRVIAAVFDRIDLLVTPTMALPPKTISEALRTAAEPALPLIRNTIPFNVFGTPTIAVPCGFSREGLPIGLQISGPARLPMPLQRREDVLL